MVLVLVISGVGGLVEACNSATASCRLSQALLLVPHTH